MATPSEPRDAAKPRLLDLFCGAGGAAMGYARAGFEVVGVDIRPQPRYPFTFEEAGALGFLERLLWRSLKGEPIPFDVIHASPPCQEYSEALSHLANPQLALIDPTRSLLRQTGLPWVIENVVGSDLPVQPTLDGRQGVQLCGTMFGLKVYRHRLFETSWPIASAPRDCNHTQSALNPYNAASRRRDGIEQGAERAFAKAMGVEWMSGKRGALKSEIGEAIPPAYTEWIGDQLYPLVAAKQEVAA